MDDLLGAIQSLGLDIHTLGLGLIVLGAAFVCSGLILLPRGKRAARASSEEIAEIRNHMGQMQQHHLPPR